MIIAKVIDSIWATRKADKLDGLKFVLVEELTGDSSLGRRLVAVDIIGAGIGDRVIISCGFSAREMIGNGSPIDAVIVGIIDEDCQFR
jgi:ethanolamine utilization protein EutN